MLEKLHIELSTRCVLACPACPRTWFAEKFHRATPRYDLDLDVFEAFMDCAAGRDINHFHLEGNHSDSIYAPHLLEFIDRWRDTKTFRIVTNGSRMKPEFWRALTQRLGRNDCVEFSIDGLEDTNAIYRINSEWSSIMQAIDTVVAAGVPTVWKTIIFKHNQDQLDQIRTLALSKGIGDFRTVMTHRFGGDQYRPDSQMIDSKRLYENSCDISDVTPACDQGGQLYVAPDHYCWPCCWISSYRTLHHTTLWKERQDWSIENHNLDDIVSANQKWADLIYRQPQNSHAVCRMMCGG